METNALQVSLTRASLYSIRIDAVKYQCSSVEIYSRVSSYAKSSVKCDLAKISSITGTLCTALTFSAKDGTAISFGWKRYFDELVFDFFFFFEKYKINEL